MSKRTEILKAKTRKVILVNILVLLSCLSFFGQELSKLESGIEFRKKGEFDSAFVFLHEHLLIGQDQAKTFMQLGIVCDMRGDFAASADYYQQAIGAHSPEDGQMLLAQIFDCQGASFSKQGELDQALESYHRSFQIKQHEGDSSEIARTIQNQAIVLKKRGEYTGAADLYHEALSMLPEGEQDIRGSIYNNLGSLYSRESNADSSLFYYHLHRSIVQASGKKARLVRSFKNLKNLHADHGAWDSAYHYATLYSVLREQVFSQESELAIADLESKIESARLKSQLQDSALEASKRQLILFGTILILVLAGVLCVLISRRRNVVQRARSKAIIEGRELESRRIADILLMEAEGSLRISQEQLPDHLSDNRAFDKAIKAIQFVANLEYNQFIDVGLKPAVEFLLEQLRNEKYLIINEDIADVDLLPSTCLHAYRSVEALVINAIKFQKAGTLSVTIHASNGKLTIAVRSNGESTHETTLYQSAAGRVYQAQGKITTETNENTTETKIEIPL